MEPKRCPVCQASTTLVGSVRGSDRSLVFLPSGIQPSLFEPGVPLIWHACLSCGHLWAGVAPGALRNFVDVRGTEMLKQHVEQLDKGLAHDLPDFLKSRQAADQAAEIDGLILAGKPKEATRRYRELTGATWDQTLEIMRTWQNFKRDEKLALFGWHTEGKVPAFMTNDDDNPMADRWLDGLPARRPPDDGPVDK